LTREKVDPISLGIIDSEFSCTLEITDKSLFRVLHVDDDTCILEISKAILEMNGEYQVETASSVDEALKKMREQKYDVVVSDYQMPGKDGLQFLRELREKGNNISFVLFTGEGYAEMSVEALGLGADAYVSKIGSPETVFEELMHGIESATERARTEIKVLQNRRNMALAK
jgi:DNA-binding NtrC family response regulator